LLKSFDRASWLRHLGNIETKFLKERFPLKYITKNVQKSSKLTSFSSSFNIRNHSVSIDANKKSNSINGFVNISPKLSSTKHSISASIPFQASISNGRVNNVSFQSVISSISSSSSRRFFSTQTNQNQSNNDNHSHQNNTTNDHPPIQEDQSLRPHIEQTALNLLKILIVMVIAIIAFRLLNDFLMILANIWTISTYALFTAIGYSIGLPIFGFLLMLVSVRILSHLPWFLERKHYEKSFTEDAVTELSKRKDIQEEFGTPIKVTNWNFTDREIVSKDKHKIVMNNKFTIEGPKRRGFVTTTASSQRPKYAWNSKWSFDQISFSPKPQKSFIDGKKIKDPQQ